MSSNHNARFRGWCENWDGEATWSTVPGSVVRSRSTGHVEQQQRQQDDVNSDGQQRSLREPIGRSISLLAPSKKKDQNKRPLIDVLNLRKTIHGQKTRSVSFRRRWNKTKRSLSSFSTVDKHGRWNSLPPMTRMMASIGSVSSSMSNSLQSSFLSIESCGTSSNCEDEVPAQSEATSVVACAIHPRNRRRESDEVSGNVLHLACQWHPPLHVLERLVKECGRSYVSELNTLGQTPLHVAAGRGASPQVISFLLQLCPGAATVQDHKGRTPLHLACECSRRGNGWCDTGISEKGYVRRNSSSSWSVAVTGSDGTVVRAGPLPAVVKALIEAAPESVNVLDHKRRNALEYAIFLGAGFKVVKALHKASEEEWHRLNGKSRKTRNSFCKNATPGCWGPWRPFESSSCMATTFMKSPLEAPRTAVTTPTESVRGGEHFSSSDASKSQGSEIVTSRSRRRICRRGGMGLKLITRFLYARTLMPFHDHLQPMQEEEATWTQEEDLTAVQARSLSARCS